MRHNENTITLLYTSDIHGHWTREDGQSGGSLACAAQYASNLRSTRKHVWMIDNGDLLQGTPLASHVALHEEQYGAKMIGDLLRTSGVDMTVPGNHDFDYGMPYLQGVIASSSCVWLAANVRHCSGNGLAEAYHIVQFGTRRIAFIGVTTRIPAKQYPDRVTGWEWHDEVATIRTILAQVRSSVDAVVVCYHGGVEQEGVRDEENAALRIAREVEGIDVLLTGHQHDRFVRREGKTLILQPGSHGTDIGEVTLTFVTEEETERMAAEGRIVDITGHEESAAVLTEALKIRSSAEAALAQVLCQCDSSLELHDWRDLPLREHPIVQWMHEVQLQESRAQLSAAAYAGEKPFKLSSGQLTRGDIQRIFPYMDALSIFQIKGTELLAALEVSASWYNEATQEPEADWLKPHLLLYQFIMFEGIQYTIDASRPIGSRIQACHYKGHAVRHDDAFTIVMTDYLADQASMYPMLRRMKRIYRLEEPLVRLLEKYAGSQHLLQIDAAPNWEIIGGI
ncbi:bifunctional metallophosphatase/5'-nucleotidase [Paenibacillus aquistagni]|uniref:2',3'-cyclic-nucleotide 2'-phosphodiesterase / 3'-nucleotidase n=1 Tax=Paenibacillus aquistagni TaxID=1852522 RepID=A0A1X7KMG2_9BACL|nr:bifunctional UDP-sugar hydrolase/5'-nucleotidase [Paenibacillus aquistagni]SMG41909.1 2',3'-cyclic-nucleotide 2'-phosphodiesterase / 3'-nucleotidase [Paenibacillus aquistagni]